MRLIDADKAIKNMQYYYDDCAETSEYTRLGFETAIEVVKDSPTVETIQKADYETRLKADMVAMLTEIQLEIEETVKEEELIDKKWANGLHYSEKIIQQKIDKMREG